MEKINVAQLLKDCPSGMELDCSMFDGVEFDSISIVDNDPFPIQCRVKNLNGGYDFYYFTKYGYWNNDYKAKCVIFPKGKISWEGFVPPCLFKDGDIVFYDNCVSIFKEWGDETLFRNYVKVDIDGRHPMLCDRTHSNGKGIKREARFATEEEKAKLFDAIKEKGYRWDSETKTLEKLIEPKFKDGDIVTSKDNGLLVACIYKERKNTESFNHYIALYKGCLGVLVNVAIALTDDKLRFATEDEKAKLFQVIKDNGYKWNEETKTLEVLPKFKVGDRIKQIGSDRCYIIKNIEFDRYILNNNQFIRFADEDIYELVPDKFDITTLKPFESRVLVRTKNFHDKWTAGFFSHKDPDMDFAPFWTTADKNYQQCIPYEGNEHLLGKKDDCNKYFKTWE